MQRTDVGPQRYRAAILAVCLLACGLRVYRLGYHPLWWDEGNTLFYAARSLAENVAATILVYEVHPPVYRMGVGQWQQLAGTSPFAVRYVSVAAGVLSVALTWAIGRRLIGPRAAAIGTLFVAIAPVQVHYSQEAKGYMVVQAALLAATWIWLRLDARARGSRTAARAGAAGGWLGYTLAVGIAVGTHYMALFLIGAHGLWTLVRAPFAGRANLRDWLRFALPHGAALLIVALALLPWVLATGAAASRGVASVSRPQPGVANQELPDYLARFAAEFAAGPVGAESEGLAAAASLALAGLALAGAAVLIRAIRRGRSSLPAIVLLGWALVPLAAGFVFQLRYAFFFPRFLLYVTPALGLLAGLAVDAVWGAAGESRARAGLALGLIALQAGLGLIALLMLYTKPVLVGEDWRPLLLQLRPYLRSEDAVVYTYVWVEGYFRSYLPGVEPEYVLGYYSPGNVDAELGGLSRRHERVWLVDYRTTAGAPGNLAANWLNAHAARVSTFADGGEIVLYASPPAEAPGAAQATAVFGGRLRLRYTARSDLPADGVVAFRLVWEALEPISDDLRVYLHVLAPDGALLAASDGIPVNGLAPAFTWQPGQPVVDLRGVLLPPSTPAGYRVTVGVYNAETGQRWTAADASGRALGAEVEVSR